MLGSDRFQFETPNAIDEGDLPPTRPQNSTAETTSSDEDDYQEARNQRLINDINELELSASPYSSSSSSSPVKLPLPRSSRIPFRDFPKQKKTHHKAASHNNNTYSPYDDDGNSHSSSNLHSLPSHEEARMHAAALLQQQNLARTVKVPGSRKGGPSKHLVRNRILWVAAKALVALLAVVVVVSVVVGVSKKLLTDKDQTLGVADYSGTDRFENLVTFLTQVGVSSVEDLQQNGTPQNAAANWIAGADPLQYAIPNDTSFASGYRIVQRYVLVVLYLSTGGLSEWTNDLHFASGLDECSWYEVVATPGYIVDEIALGVSCDTDFVVTSVYLPENGLVGYLPAELRFLPQVNLLNFQDNRLSGELPNLLDCQDLLYFNVNNNTLSGSIPDYFGSLQRLQVLGLELNDFEGIVPASLSGAGNLKTLSLSFNAQLGGSLDFARSLTRLMYFYADHCNFQGRVENNFFQYMPELRELDLSHNELTGRVPLDILFQETTLVVLNLAYNQFTGEFPYQLETNVFLTYLNLRHNQLSGSIPPSIEQLVELDHLDLQDNQFSGLVPNSIGDMKKLTFLFLGGNQFDATVPPLNQLVNLRELSLSGIGISGPIPDWFRWMSELQMLDLSHNILTGTIPADLWNLPQLYFLFLHNNELQGPLPAGGSQLDVVTLHKNNIEGADDGFDDVCTNALDLENLQIISDCGAGCSKECCSECCLENDDSCGSDLIEYFVDGLEYKGDFFAFDPDILDEAGLFETYDALDTNSEQPPPNRIAPNYDNYDVEPNYDVRPNTQQGNPPPSTRTNPNYDNYGNNP